MENNDKFLFVGNGTFQNRGCEAIVLGTMKILRAAFSNPRFVHANFDQGVIPYEVSNSDKNIAHAPIPIPHRWSAKWFTRHLCSRLYQPAGDSVFLHQLKKHIQGSRAILSVGGDNYSLDYGVPKSHFALDRYMERHGNPLVIWGASVGPFDKMPEIERYIIKHLNDNVGAIFVREEETKRYLEKINIERPIVLMSDPAFVMDAEETPDDVIGFEIPANAIGINLSPLMAKYVCSGNLAKWIEIGVDIVSSIVRTIQAPVVLIPHVTVPHDNDYNFLSSVIEKLDGRNENVFLLPPHLSAPQLKWVISHLDCLVAARTHATIASLSSLVPTISLGYSIKSIGINKMLFGHSGYLISAKDVEAAPIIDLLKHILAERDAIKNHLNSKISEISRMAFNAGNILKELM